jgi:hypothetical protein
MTGTNCDLFTHKSSPSYLNDLVIIRFDENKEEGRVYPSMLATFAPVKAAEIVWVWPTYGNDKYTCAKGTVQRSQTCGRFVKQVHNPLNGQRLVEH